MENDKCSRKKKEPLSKELTATIKHLKKYTKNIIKREINAIMVPFRDFSRRHTCVEMKQAQSPEVINKRRVLKID